MTATFTTEVQLDGGFETAIDVPPDVARALADGGSIPVSVTVGAIAFRSRLVPAGEKYRIPLPADQRAAAGIVAGDLVEVSVTLLPTPEETSARRAKIPRHRSPARAPLRSRKTWRMRSRTVTPAELSTP